MAKFYTSTLQSSCNDSFTFGYRIADLVSACNLATDNIDPNSGLNSSNWVRYRGDHYVYYNETVTLPVNNDATLVNLTRTGRLVTPMDVYIYRLYSSELNSTANTTIQVYSPFQLKAAVTSTNVKANATTSYVGITFGISSPYEISFMTTYTQTGQGQYMPGIEGSPGPNDVIAYAVTGSGIALTNQLSVNQSDNVGLTPCTSYDENGFCWKTVNFMLLLQDPTLCSLGHTFTIDTIGVTCDSAHSGPDCPLSPDPNTQSSLQFTVNADNFCDGSRALVINDAITIKAYIPQRVQSRSDTTPLRSFTINDEAYLTLFIDTDVSLKVFAMTVLPANASGFVTKLSGGVYTAPAAASDYIYNVNNGVGLNGFHVATQTHSMKVTLNCEFVQDNSTPRNCLVAPGVY